jgi:hypothetical protein
MEACFGPWRLATPWSNVRAVHRTGPYAAWKVAGPARLSLADRGLTFAATIGPGVCVELRRPERGVEPIGLLRHPGVTLGVEDVDAFIDLADRFRAADSLASVPPRHPRGHFLPALRAAWRWQRRTGSVDHECGGLDDIDHTDPPHIPSLPDGQRPEHGAGPGYHRRYAIEVDAARRELSDAVAAIQTDPNVLAEVHFSPFTKLRGELGTMQVGDRYLVEIAGPWKGAVEVIAMGPRFLRLATLNGHMEAGVIEFRFSERAPGRLGLTIESWARSSDRILDALYDKLGLARMLQSEMWVLACERFAELVGGRPAGPVEVTTERDG